MDGCDCDAAKAKDGYPDCEIHVHCDRWCGALTNPVTLEETRAALAHWRTHSYMYGCAHGC